MVAEGALTAVIARYLLIFPASRVGFGTVIVQRTLDDGLPGLLRADPSAPLDERYSLVVASTYDTSRRVASDVHHPDGGRAWEDRARECAR
ncbi:hypothetical protein GCM10009634_28710 [Saccharothrix xinjiangensis]